MKKCDSYIDCKEGRSTLFLKKEYVITECTTCGHRFTEISDRRSHLATVYSDNYFFAGEDGYPNYLHDKDLLYKEGIRYARLISKYRDPGKVLDVGSAAGFILKGFEQSGWSCQGLEPNETMAAYGRNILHLDVKTGALETFETEEKFDLVNLIQVIGHIYDLDKALENVKHLLKREGLVLVESWNMKSVIARVLGKRWPEYSPPSVVHWYSDKTLAELFNYHGFKLVTKGYSIKKISAHHALSFIEGKISNLILRKLIDSSNRLIGKFSFIYPFFDVKWYIFKKF
jgi:SAM-dependent methyltransferase